MKKKQKLKLFEIIAIIFGIMALVLLFQDVDIGNAYKDLVLD